jgi:hypothetical protein
VTHIEVDDCILATDTININGCELLLEESGYHVILMSLHCGLMLVKIVHSRILIFSYFELNTKGYSGPGLVCMTSDPLFQ